MIVTVTLQPIIDAAALTLARVPLATIGVAQQRHGNVVFIEGDDLLIINRRCLSFRLR